MSTGRRLWRATGVACALVLLVVAGGCSSDDRDPGANAQQAGTSASVPSVAPVTGDTRACTGAQAVIGHITVDTVRWSPSEHPFDKTVSARLSAQSINLAAQGQQADDPAIRRAVHDTASTFAAVAQAMASHKRAGVDGAIRRSRVAYKVLKQVCAFDDGEG